MNTTFTSKLASARSPMSHLSSEFLKRAAATLLILLILGASASSARQVHFTRSLSGGERRCLAEMLRDGHWRRSPQFHQVMLATAAAARADLKGNGPKQVIFVMTDFSFCGTAGCSMLIGEERHNGTCQELYDGSGFTHAIAVLRKRDHGYRGLYTPCELRFDGHEYQQIHEECPTINVQR